MLGYINLFFALVPCPECMAALCQMQEWFRDRGLQRLRWLKPEQLHLSLMSLGYFREPSISQVINQVTGLMEQAAEECEPFMLRIDKAGQFVRSDQPTVLRAGVSGEVELLHQL